MAGKRKRQSVAKTKRANPGADALMRVHLDLDRKLWWKFKSHCSDRGWTLKSRVSYLIECDMEGKGVALK